MPAKALPQGLRPRNEERRCHRNQSIKQGLGHRSPVISWTLHQTWRDSHEPLNLWELSLHPTDAQDLAFRECAVCNVLSVGGIICKMREQEMGTISLPPPPPGGREKVVSVASFVNSSPHQCLLGCHGIAWFQRVLFLELTQVLTPRLQGWVSQQDCWLGQAQSPYLHLT